MHSYHRLLLIVPLLLLPSACVSATAGAPPVRESAAPAPDASTKAGADNGTPPEAPSRLRIPIRPSAPDSTFDHIQRACKAARSLGNQRAGLARLAAQNGVSNALAATPPPPAPLKDSLKRAQDDLTTARDAEIRAQEDARSRAVHPAATAIPAVRTPPPAAEPPPLAAFVRSYGAFLDQVAGIQKRCDSVRGDLKKAAIADVDYLASLTNEDVRALESQQKAFAESVSFSRADIVPSSLSQLLENEPNSAAGSAATSQTPGLGSLESVILQGLADFVVTRAKAEAVKWVQERLSTELCKEPMGAKLSRTCLAFKELSPDLSLQAMGSYLQAAALSDLEGLPEALLAGSKDRADIAAALHLGIMVSREVYAGQSPLEVLRSVQHVMCATAPDAKSFGGIAQAACRASILVDAIVRQRRDGGNVSTQAPDDVGMLAATALRATMKALGAAGTPLADLDAERFDAMAAETQALVAEVESIEKDLQALLKDAKGGKVPATARLAVTSRAVSAFVRAARTTVCLTKGVTCNDAAVTDPALTALAGVESAAEFASALFAHDAAGLGLAVQAALKLLPKTDDAGVAMLRKMLPLLVELASAKKSADVATALEAAAAPVGSYTAKYDRTSIAINGFLGVSAGPEITPTGKWSGTGALYAPIGLHMTTPLGSGHAWFHGGLFVSVIDLGALTATRLATELGTDDGKSPTVETTANIGFAQIFSPGLFVTLGVGQSPIVVGGGAAVTPSLRKAITLENGVSKTDELPAVRVQGFVALDLTLLPF